MAPYIVSADIKLLLGRWAEERGFVLPSDAFFVSLRSEFNRAMRGIFSDYEFVPEEELTQGLTEMVQASMYPVVSIDRAYYSTGLTLDITRLCQTVENGSTTVGARHGKPSVDEQIERIRQASSVITLLDDVVFEGQTLLRLIEVMRTNGIQVASVIAGIGIGEGVNRIQEIGVGVRCVRRYASAIDEVCERDFYPGVPFSGRSLAGDANVGISYLLPDGKPEKWASIPSEWCRPISRACLNYTYELFSQISRCSERKVLISDLDRRLYGYTDGAMSVLEMIQSMELRIDGVTPGHAKKQSVAPTTL